MHVGQIVAIEGDPRSGLAFIVFTTGHSVPISSGHGLRQLAAAFGSLEEVIGRTIRFEVDGLGVMSAFASAEEVRLS
jgi:hypothetical protein